MFRWIPKQRWYIADMGIYSEFITVVQHSFNILAQAGNVDKVNALLKIQHQFHNLIQLYLSKPKFQSSIYGRFKNCRDLKIFQI